MNPIKPKKIHEIHTAVSISEKILIDGCSHLALSEETFATLVSDAKSVLGELQINRRYQGSDWTYKMCQFALTSGKDNTMLANWGSNLIARWATVSSAGAHGPRYSIY
jgi:hypothetical protein